MASRPARLVVAAFAMLLAPESLAAQGSSGVVARVGGEPIMATELEDAWHRNDAASRIRMLQEPTHDGVRWTSSSASDSSSVKPWRAP